MKRLVFAAGVLAVLLIGQAGMAKTLEEVLKEKGVITEADLKEVTPGKPVAYQLGKGFTFTSPDGKFQLSLGGRGQFLYQYVDKDDVNGAAQGDRACGGSGGFKVFMGGYAFTKDLTYRVQVDLAKSGTAQMLEDAWINYRLSTRRSSRRASSRCRSPAGSSPPTGRCSSSTARTPWTPSSPATTSARWCRGRRPAGSSLITRGCFNGTGQSGTRTTNSGAWAARVMFNPFGEMRYSEADLENTPNPLLSVGAELLREHAEAERELRLPRHHHLDPAVRRDLRVAREGRREHGDLRQHGTGRCRDVRVRRGVQVEGALRAGRIFRRESRRAEFGKDRSNVARVLRAGGVLPSAEAARGRGPVLLRDPNRDKPRDRQVEVTGAVSYYFQGHNLKVQSDYTNIHIQQAVGSSRRTTSRCGCRRSSRSDRPLGGEKRTGEDDIDETHGPAAPRPLNDHRRPVRSLPDRPAGRRGRAAPDVHHDLHGEFRPPVGAPPAL